MFVIERLTFPCELLIFVIDLSCENEKSLKNKKL